MKKACYQTVLVCGDVLFGWERSSDFVFVWFLAQYTIDFVRWSILIRTHLELCGPGWHSKATHVVFIELFLPVELSFGFRLLPRRRVTSSSSSACMKPLLLTTQTDSNCLSSIKYISKIDHFEMYSNLTRKSMCFVVVGLPAGGDRILLSAIFKSRNVFFFLYYKLKSFN